MRRKQAAFICLAGALLGFLLMFLGTDLSLAHAKWTAPVVPAPAAQQGGAAGPVLLYEGSVSLLTYPYERYQSAAVDPQYNWPYQRFDYDRFRVEVSQPAPRTYRTVVLENDYLRIVILPELGGRIWRVVHKPSGNDLFYRNSVVMPSPWGPADMRGWLALGGLEWSLPVVEHGYDWGTRWEVTPLQDSGNVASVLVTMPHDGRPLEFNVKITLCADEASFTIEPSISNNSEQPVRFAFWHNAALAPGRANHPSASTHFVVPGDAVTVHSTEDQALPGAGHTMAWPLVKGRDMSQLGNWDQYLGFFERPAAHGPFVGIYDRAQDAGGVRIYPASVMRGSKVFGLGWHDALDPSYYTNDDSAYVEMHGGLAPTFGDQISLAAGNSITWREHWYPVYGIGDLTYAGEAGALNWQNTPTGLHLGFYPTRPAQGTLVVADGRKVVARVPFQARPDSPFLTLVELDAPINDALSVSVEDGSGTLLLAANGSQFGK